MRKIIDIDMEDITTAAIDLALGEIVPGSATVEDKFNVKQTILKGTDTMPNQFYSDLITSALANMILKFLVSEEIRKASDDILDQLDKLTSRGDNDESL